MSDCKVSTFFHFVSVWDDPFPAPTFYRCAITIVMSHYSTAAQTINSMRVATMGGGMETGEIAEKGHWLSS